MRPLASTQAKLPFATETVVNVASVPQYSPFRYAGGKTWLIPQIRLWLASLPYRPEEFIEPFAGGASVGLTVGIENLADHVTLVELDQDVCSVWQSVFGGEAEQLADRVLDFRFTRPAVLAVLDSVPTNRLDRAFRTIIRNRVIHGGILAPGASVMREGENGKGLGSRWYPETLYRRIIRLGAEKRMFRALRLDGLGIVNANAQRERAVFFIDPPYTVAGRRLYTHFEVDHSLLFKRCSKISGEFLMTYDDAPEVRLLAKKHGFDVATIPMKSRQHTVKNELLIGNDLHWIRRVG
ncbi:MAG: DNA adenine methylase [Phycisphaerales bacterium]